MGKIFGISDLPISTIMTALEEVRVPEPIVRDIPKVSDKTRILLNTLEKDVYVSDKISTKSNPIIKLRNGFGKLMKHFSKSGKNPHQVK